ncbi:DUF885 domain-containing protein [Massilia arenosa]|uniref:DUF885 domain-containing protein n=1 Tax=Zemynaea arenosa TaxID=2561931 RepID=A0A4Y9SMG3_9BURK|nr:DUF885 domain-containing protein [Massilia arenosa]TFW25776.1 DUF885 domain-containing protein [Massilia arenosa]
MKRHTLACAIAAALLLCGAPFPSFAAGASATATKTAATAPAQQMATLADRYYAEIARFDPIGATENGDIRYNDQLTIAIAPKVRAQHLARFQQFLRQLHTIPRARLAHRDQVSYDIMDYELTTTLALERFPDHLLPVSQMDSVPVMLANYAGGQSGQPLKTPQDYRAFLKRLNNLPAWLDQAVLNMREGMRTGVVQPKAVVTAMLPQFRKLTSKTVEENIYYSPITNMPATFSAADKAKFKAEYSALLKSRLMPALDRFANFLEQDYLPAARTSAGWSALPQGEAWYRAYVASSTTTSMTPEQIHAKGLSEVARIQQEYAALGPKMGYDGPASGLPNWVAQQAKFKPFTSDQQVLEVFRQLDATLRTKLPSLFTLMPKAPLDLRLEPELSRETASDHYTAPTADGSRPGVFWSVVNDPKQYGSTGMVTLFLHEGQPGHHFHIALLQELGLPDFRKFGGNNAFTEGWALYAETLGKEMGLFDKPEDYFGHLNDQMLRAVRLVVDTGMHEKGWTREQAIAYMRETLGYSEDEARNQVERYMAWPGQALSYKIGALKIQELRARAEQALGPKFSLPKFHEIVLGDGTLPLALLEAKVDAWIAASK